jgi:small-conductance mechanosensitive channel
MKFTTWFTLEHLIAAAGALVLIFLGHFFSKKASDAVDHIRQFDSQQKLLLKKVTYYGLMSMFIASALNWVGFDLRVILGAAGLLTVALGFAAQTSASNLISGLFLIVDRPFVVGDVIEVGHVKGEVIAIDFLSTKIRTFDNVLVRVPNETMNKSDIRNLTFFPIRRIDLNFGVGYDSNLVEVERLLRNVANRNPLCLQEPKPLFVFSGFGESAMNLQFSVWTLRGNMTELTAQLATEIRHAFASNEIEIPYPHRKLFMHAAPAVEPGGSPST